MKVLRIEPSIVGSIVVIFAIGLLVNQLELVFAEETQIESELETIQNSIDALGEKSYHAKYLGNDLFQIKQIGKTIDNKISQENNPEIKAKLIKLSDKYNRAALSFIDNISKEQLADGSSASSKQLVTKTKAFVVNIDVSTNKKIEKFEKADFVKSELKRLDAEERFRDVFIKQAAKISENSALDDPLMDTIRIMTEKGEYDLPN